MELLHEYVVYGLLPLDESENRLTLFRVDFGRYLQNSFIDEMSAMQALMVAKKTYRDYIIVKQVFIRE